MVYCVPRPSHDPFDVGVLLTRPLECHDVSDFRILDRYKDMDTVIFQSWLHGRTDHHGDSYSTQNDGEGNQKRDGQLNIVTHGATVIADSLHLISPPRSHRS